MFEPLRCSRYHEGRSTPVTEAHNPNAADSPVEGGSPLLVGFFSVVAMSALVIRRTSR